MVPFEPTVIDGARPESNPASTTWTTYFPLWETGKFGGLLAGAQAAPTSPRAARPPASAAGSRGVSVRGTAGHILTTRLRRKDVPSGPGADVEQLVPANAEHLREEHPRVRRGVARDDLGPPGHHDLATGV